MFRNSVFIRYIATCRNCRDSLKFIPPVDDADENQMRLQRAMDLVREPAALTSAARVRLVSIHFDGSSPLCGGSEHMAGKFALEAKFVETSEMLQRSRERPRAQRARFTRGGVRANAGFKGAPHPVIHATLNSPSKSGAGVA